jgi:hypothetical protein
MIKHLFTLSKLGLLAIYVLALAAFAGVWTSHWSPTVQTTALLLLAVHTIELVLMFRLVRLYRGPLIISILLTLLFGLLHWQPLVALASPAQDPLRP